jgi:ATP-binding cassette, subfamily B, bacterial MsbA
MLGLQPFMEFFRCMRRWKMGARIALLSAFGVLGALAEGMGVGILIPMLESLQNSTGPIGTYASSSISNALARVFGRLGLPFTLPVILAVGVGLFITQAVFTYVRSILTIHAQDRLTFSMRTRVFANLLNSSLAYFHSSRIGELINTLTTESQRAGFALAEMIQMVAMIFLLGIYMLVQIAISWQLTLAAFPILALIAFWLRPRKSYAMGVDFTQENETLQSTSFESLSGIREIKALNLESLSLANLRQSAERLMSIDIRYQNRGYRFTMIYQSVVMIVFALIVIFANRTFKLSFASMLAFLLVLQRFAPRVGQLTEYRHWWLGYSRSVDRIEQIIHETEHVSAELMDGTVPFNRLEHAISLHEVEFAYGSHAGAVLHKVSLTFPKGKMTAIVGASGAGKSTLLDLIARFYDPSSGGIKVDEKDLRNFQIATWRQAIGMVSQETFLFNDTIGNNIRYGCLRATQADIEEAARRAYAHEFIANMPEQYQTKIGDRGVKLSGGQRQRLALARALLRKPQILLLDEATSELDTASERFIQQAVREISQSCTVIAVAHRLSTIEHADNIIVLEHGEVVEQGTHRQLLASDGRYAAYYKMQFGNVIVASETA